LGITDLLPDGERSGGLIVPVSDEDAFSGALCRLVNDPALRDQLAARALERASAPDFDEEWVASRLAGFLAGELPGASGEAEESAEGLADRQH
jgi:glycosyltransferase involved in cell wall biosynthesis